jgi:hypothetical protein
MSASSSLSPGQRALLAHKVHIRPGALARSTGDVQQRLISVWQAATTLVAQLSGLPEESFRWWAEQPAGHILLTEEDHGYETGLLHVGEQQLHAVVLIPLSQILYFPQKAASRALFPLDHLLGCAGLSAGSWLSEGGGVDQRWQRIGTQLVHLYELGYGLSDEGRHEPRSYLAEGIVAALHNRRQLNTADPKLDRLLHGSLLSSAFWRNFIRGVSA